MSDLTFAQDERRNFLAPALIAIVVLAIIIGGIYLYVPHSVADIRVTHVNVLPEHTVFKEDVGSIIVVVATDAPLIPTQLKRIAKKVSLGLGRDGSYSGDGSGDIFIAFSTANPGAVGTTGLHQLTMLPNDSLDPLFLATVQATEEAVVNAMVAAETMTGINHHTVIALPHDRLREALKKYNRLAK